MKARERQLRLITRARLFSIEVCVHLKDSNAAYCGAHGQQAREPGGAALSLQCRQEIAASTGNATDLGRPARRAVCGGEGLEEDVQ